MNASLKNASWLRYAMIKGSELPSDDHAHLPAFLVN